MIIVAKDGSGDFTSIQEAVDALPEAVGDVPSLIKICPGIYREKVVIHRNSVRIIGEDPENTVVTWSACAKDLHEDGTEKTTFLSATLMTTGRNIEIESLTVRTDAAWSARQWQSMPPATGASGAIAASSPIRTLSTAALSARRMW